MSYIKSPSEEMSTNSQSSAGNESAADQLVICTRRFHQLTKETNG